MPEDQDRPVTAAEVTNEIAEAIERAGLHPAHAFSVRQCGYLFTYMSTHARRRRVGGCLDHWFELRPNADPLCPTRCWEARANRAT